MHVVRLSESYLWLAENGMIFLLCIAAIDPIHNRNGEEECGEEWI